MPQPQVLSQRPISRPLIPWRSLCRGSTGIELVTGDRCHPIPEPIPDRISAPFSHAAVDVLRRHQP